MSYPGNASLSSDIQSRILSTFEQTLDLAAQGNQQEALLGCDFVLRLDPMFEPARTLQERLQAPGDVRIDDLKVMLQAAPPAAPQETPTLEDSTQPAEPEAAHDTIVVSPPAVSDAPETSFADLNTTLEELNSEDTDISALGEPAAPPQVATIPTTPAPPADQPSAAEAGAGLDLSGLEDLDLSAPSDEPAEGSGMPTLPTSESAAEPVPEPTVVPADESSSEREFELGSSPNLDSESQSRIDALLAEGQEAFDRGDHQPAIDSWSRIFLIDIDHKEAARRIELARKLKDEVDRKVEEAFHDAVTHMERGATAQAKEAFERVLEMQPSHLAAKEYLEQIDSGGKVASAAPTELPELDVSAISTPSPEDVLDDRPIPGDDLLTGFDEDLSSIPPHVPTETPVAEPPPTPKPSRPERKARGRGPLYVGVGVLVVVLGGGWFLYTNWDSLFQNADDQTPAQQAQVETSPIDRATQLHGEGKTALAVARLRRLPPNSPHYAEAQALIAQWETPTTDDAKPEDTDEAARELQEELIARARQAYAQREYLQASEVFDQAARIAPLTGSVAEIRQDVQEQLKPIQSQIDMIRQGDWEFALPTLWRLQNASPGNPDVEQLIVVCYYNMGIRDLQRGDVASATEKLDEATALAPGDPDLKRLREFAEVYTTRSTDLLYRIFVKYLPLRPLLR